jgi:hypothetical protein
MAFPASGLFVATQVSAGTGAIVLDYGLETHRGALYTNAITADLTTDTAYGVAPWNANEVANGNGYTTGGVLLTTTVYVHTATGVVKWDFDDPTWAAPTTITARGILYYADALAGNNAIAAANFGADVVSTNGSFVVAIHANGIFTVDWVP